MAGFIVGSHDRLGLTNSNQQYLVKCSKHPIVENILGMTRKWRCIESGFAGVLTESKGKVRMDSFDVSNSGPAGAPTVAVRTRSGTH